MDIDSVRAQIEKDLAWRLEEIAFFARQLNNFKPLDMNDGDKQSVENKRVEGDKERFRKALVLMLYAHFEGFFRSAFTLYVSAINEERISLSEAIDELVASSLYNEFGKYDNIKALVDQESSEINKTIKRLKNRVEWIKEFDELRQKKVIMLPISSRHNDKNSIIYTESNLNSEIIEKILYRLGFPSDIFNFQISGKTFKDILNEFLGRRNPIAHGEQLKEGINEKQYNEFKDVFDKITDIIPKIITRALNEKLYLKEDFRC